MGKSRNRHKGHKHRLHEPRHAKHAAHHDKHKGGKKKEYECDFGRMIHQLQPLGLDGNCLFRVLSHQLEDGSEREHERYRAEIMQYIDENGEDFVPFLTEPMEKYLARMRNDSAWGGNMEIVAASRLYQCTIVVHQLDAARFVVQPSDIGTHLPANGAPHSSSTRQSLIQVAYLNEQHYACVCPLDSRHGVALGIETECPCHLCQGVVGLDTLYDDTAAHPDVDEELERLAMIDLSDDPGPDDGDGATGGRHASGSTSTPAPRDGHDEGSHPVVDSGPSSDLSSLTRAERRRLKREEKAAKKTLKAQNKANRVRQRLVQKYGTQTASDAEGMASGKSGSGEAQTAVPTGTAASNSQPVSDAHLKVVHI